MLYDGKAVPDINRVVLQLLKVEVLKIYERTPHGTRRYRRTESRPPPPCGGEGEGPIPSASLTGLPPPRTGEGRKPVREATSAAGPVRAALRRNS